MSSITQLIGSVLLVLAFSSQVSAAKYAKFQFCAPGCGCDTHVNQGEGEFMYLSTDDGQGATTITRCHNVGEYFGKVGGSVFVNGTDVRIHDSADCTGPVATPELNDCLTNANGFHAAKLLGFNESLPAVGAGVTRKSIKMNAAACVDGDNNDIVFDGATDVCMPTGRDVTGQRYLKYASEAFSAQNSLNSYAYYENNTCSDAYWAHPPTQSLSCSTARYGTEPSSTCTSAPCDTHFPTSGDQISFFFESGVNAFTKGTPINYAKMRFYQDAVCSFPDTYKDPDLLTIDTTAHMAYQRTDQINQLQKAQISGLAPGVQPFDGNAIGQTMYVATGATHCTALDIGINSTGTTINSDINVQNPDNWVSHPEGIIFRSVKCVSNPSILHSPIENHIYEGVLTPQQVGTPYWEIVGPCDFYTSGDCSGPVASVIENTTHCNNKLYAKVESFDIGVEWIQNSYQALKFYDQAAGAQETYLSQECGGEPAIISGQLDTCQVATNVGMGQFLKNKNTGAVLADDRQYSPFTKVTGSLRSTETYDVTYYDNSDCTGVGSRTENKNLGVCRADVNTFNQLRVGTYAFAGSMTPAQRLGSVYSRGLLSASSAGIATSDAIGCPDVVNYVYDEGMYDMGLSNGVNDHRACAVVFQSPPGTTIMFEWATFHINTGSCSGAPLNCYCGDEHLIIRDGARKDSRQVGQNLCGVSFDEESTPANIIFSGNTARIEFVGTIASSTFSIWVAHHFTKVDFKLPENPSFALGNDISIDWVLETSFASWPECNSGVSELSNTKGVGHNPGAPDDEPWTRRLTCARSSAKDHGWIGLYRKGACEKGEFVSVPHTVTNDPSETHPGFSSYEYAQGQRPHDCYLATRTIPIKTTRGSVIFHYGADFHESGWFDLRYFSGDASGTVCEVDDNDPESSTKNKRCLFEPITRGEIYISRDRVSYSGTTQKQQMPGYERTINA